jgi:uncharacterized protein YggT (Ycf19 family)
MLKLIRLHLGRVVRWPWPLLLLLVPVCVTALWALVHFPLVWSGVLPRTISVAHLVQQALLLSLALFLTLKFVLPFILLLHFITSYVYLGNSPVWEFIASTAGRIMAPLKRLPLRVGKVDLRPVIVVALIFLLLEWLPQIVEAALVKKAGAIWPQ